MESMKLILLLIIRFMLLSQISTQDLNSFSNKGFTINLIHRDSIHSPFYPGNLTTIEKAQRLVNFSKQYALSLESSHMIRRNMEFVRPTLTMSRVSYVVPLRIGRLKLNVVFDTGCNPVWTQCSSCNPCFPQNGKKYNPRKSNTYTPLSPDHPFCDHGGQRDKCQYSLKFPHGGTEGTFGKDKFTFGSPNSKVDIIFGCSLKTYGNLFRGNKDLHGILGMDRGPESFAMQLSKQTNQPNKFSYCMTKYESSTHSTVRFGSDIKLRRPTQETSLVRTNSHYYVNLVDISVHGRRLNLKRDWFVLKPNGEGGCMLDSGSAMSHIINPVFVLVKVNLILYFKRYNVTEVDGSDLGYDLCFESRPGFKRYPHMDLHFESAKFHLSYSNLFYFMPTRFCLAITYSDTYTVIGSWQQAQHHIVYDVGNEKVIFSDDSCDKK